MHRAGPALAAIILLCSLADCAPDDEQPALKEVLALQETLRHVIKQAEPSIACILISRSEPGQRNRKNDLSDPESVPEAYGSGVVIDGRELLVLTNYHVVRDATAIYVRLPGNKASAATIYAGDPRSDLAVLRLSNAKLAPLPEIKFGDGGKVRKGDFVVSLANPFAAGFRDDSPSAALGLVRNLRQRAVSSPKEEDTRALYLSGTLLQTEMLLRAEVPLNLGCSGGALLNLKGEMIALSTSRADAKGGDSPAGFALPLDQNVKRLIDQLRKGKEVQYGFLGVTPKLDPPHRDGVQIAEVTNGSPAQRAFLRGGIEGDVIKSINGVRVHTVEDLYLTIGMLLAGSEANLEIEGRREVVKVKLVKFRVPGKIIATNKPPLIRGFRVDYTSVLWMQPNDFGRAGIPIPPGVFVSEVQEGSRAASAQLQVNDVITHVNGHRVDSPDDFYSKVQNVAATAPLTLTLAGSGWPRNGSTELTIP